MLFWVGVANPNLGEEEAVAVGDGTVRKSVGELLLKMLHESLRMSTVGGRVDVDADDLRVQSGLAERTTQTRLFPTLKRAYFLGVIVLSCYTIPLLLITVFYSLIGYRVWHRDAPGFANTSDVIRLLFLDQEHRQYLIVSLSFKSIQTTLKHQR